jgi:hypothetical protein
VTGSRGESLADILNKNREDTINRDEIIQSSWCHQVDFMEMLGVVKCIFCLLSGTRGATHTTESCRIAQTWPTVNIPAATFASRVKTWSRVMPFCRDGASLYCPYCRFPLVDHFHDSLNPRQCKYNDFLNRTAWALWHNRDFHNFVFHYSQNDSRASIIVSEMQEKEFQKWLLQEVSLGETNLFRIFSMLVRQS